MGTITQLNEKIRSVPQPLVSEDQARMAICEIVSRPPEPNGLLDAVARHGLLAGSIPDDFGGADLANELIADLVTAIAQKSEKAALSAASHFVALELVRTSGSAEQRRGTYNRILLGERLAHAGFDLADIASKAEGIGFGIELPAGTVPSFGQDWTLLPVADEDGKRGAALLSAEIARSTAETGAALHLAGDHFLPLGANGERLAAGLAELLDAAVTLGRFKQQDAEAQTPGTSAWVEWMGAMITRVAAIIDGLQVGSAATSFEKLDTAVTALTTLNLRAKQGAPL